MVGGRNLETTGRPRLTVRIAGSVVSEWEVAPGPFLRFITVPVVDRNYSTTYFPIEVTSTPSAPVAIEQFDAAATRALTGFGDGWYEPEFNPDTGRRWRWVSERGELQIAAATRPTTSGATAGRGGLTLHLEGESPRTYFSRPSHLRVSAGDRDVFDADIAADFTLDLRTSAAA